MPETPAAASFLLLLTDWEQQQQQQQQQKQRSRGRRKQKMSCFDPALASSPLWALIGGGKAEERKACSASSCSSPAPLTCSACQAAHYCSRCCCRDQSDSFHQILFTPGTTKGLTGLNTNPAARRLPSACQRREAGILWRRETLHKATSFSKNHL